MIGNQAIIVKLLTLDPRALRPILSNSLPLTFKCLDIKFLRYVVEKSYKTNGDKRNYDSKNLMTLYGASFYSLNTYFQYMF